MTRRWMLSTVLAGIGAAGCWGDGAAANPTTEATAIVAHATSDEEPEGDTLAIGAKAGERAFHAGGTWTTFYFRGLLHRPFRPVATVARAFPSITVDGLALFVKGMGRALRDQATVAEVRSRLVTDPQTWDADVRVAAYRGHVFLSGPPVDGDTAAAAVRDALRGDGVRSVHARFAR